MGLNLRKCFVLVFALALLGARPAFAQTGTVTGRVSEATTGAPLASARVEAVTTGGQVGASTLTDQDGQFRLTGLQAGTYTLVVSLVGFETQQINGVQVVAGQTTMQAVTLSATVFELNPVVVSASKRQEKAIDAPASIAVVNSRTVAERPTTTPVEHLRSVPGVDIVNAGVQSTNVVIRGFNNIFSGSLHALTDNRIAGIPSLRVNLMHFVPATDDDVERMEVVLGPGAALYGPNTADGVLHIITKSPIDHQGTTVTLGGGEQSLYQAGFRTSHRLSDQFGFKVSGQYLQADEWLYVDPVEQQEKQKFASDPLAKAQLMSAVGISSEEADRRIALIGNRDYKVTRWGVDARADWRPSEDVSVIVSAGNTLAADGIELTGLGAAQVVDWHSRYVQARGNYKRLFAQAYVNMSDAGETYLLRNGAPITDQSKLYVAQIQHGLDVGEKQTFTYGLDFIYTNPITNGTINGGYEEDDQTTEFGAYLQSETRLTDKLNLVLAGRVDTHSALPDAIFSPRAGLVFKPTESQAFRVTYNRAFSTPSSLNQFLDLGSAIPDAGAALLGYSLRVQGTGTDGFRFRQADGSYLMRSPFTPAGMGGAGQLLPANAAMFWQAAVQVAAQQANLGATPQGQALVNYLMSLNPVGQIGSAYFHPQANVVGRLDQLDLDKIDPIRESTATTFEVGYKGVISDRLLLAADVWYTRKENMVTPLLIQTPFVTLDGAQTGAYLAEQLVPFFMAAGLPEEQARAQAATTAGQLAEGLARVPVGVISSPDVNANGAQLLTTYINVDDNFDVYGLDLSATALLNNNWSVTGTLSLVNENVFETKKGEAVTLNAPKTKGSIAIGYRNDSNGLNAEFRARYHDSFPVRSGVYDGSACLTDTPAAGVEKCVDSSTLLDLTLGYRLPVLPKATLQLNVQNLTDEAYRSFPGVPTIGRMALVRLKYDL